MPRGTSTTTTTRTHSRTTRARSDAASVVGQITQLVTANETLKRENAELLASTSNSAPSSWRSGPHSAA